MEDDVEEEGLENLDLEKMHKEVGISMEDEYVFWCKIIFVQTFLEIRTHQRTITQRCIAVFLHVSSYVHMFL